MCTLNPVLFFALGGSVLCGLHGFHCPNHPIDSAKPHRSHQRPTASNLTTERFLWRIQPASTRHECFLRPCQSSGDPLCQFGRHIIRGLHRSVGETVDHVLQTGLDVGEHRRSRTGTPGQVRGASEVGTTLHHGIATRFVATCTPPFRHRPCRLSLGYRPFRCGGHTSGHLLRLRILRRYSRGCDDLERLPIQDTLIHVPSEDFALDEGGYRARSPLAEAMGHCAPTTDRTGGRERSPDGPNRAFAQDLIRFGRSSSRKRSRRVLHDVFEPCILEEKSAFRSPAHDGYNRLRSVLVARELYRFFHRHRRRRRILWVPVAVPPQFHDRADSTPRRVHAVFSSACVRQVRSSQGSAVRCRLFRPLPHAAHLEHLEKFCRETSS